MSRWATLATTVIIVAACSAGGAPEATTVAAAQSPQASPTASPAPTSTPSPSPTLAPTPTPEPTLDLGGLGAAYVAIASTLFEKSVELDARFETAATYDDYSELYAEAVRLRHEAMADLRELEFPSELTAARDRLLDSLDIAATEFDKLADDPDYDPKDRLTDATKETSAAGAEIRAFLGLPPPATPKP